MQFTNLSSGYQIRRLTPADWRLILTLMQDNTYYYQHCPPAPTRENILADLKTLPPGVALKAKAYLGFFREEKLCAILDLVVGYPNEETLYLGFFMLAKQLQQQGKGTHLITEISLFAKKAGFKYLRLGYVTTNLVARNFWLKNGFVPQKIVQQARYRVVVAQKDLTVMDY